MVGARSQNCQEGAWNAVHWEHDGPGCSSQCGGGGEAGPPLHVFHRVATLHILQGHPLQGLSNNVEDIISILRA